MIGELQQEKNTHNKISNSTRLFVLEHCTQKKNLSTQLRLPKIQFGVAISLHVRIRVVGIATLIYNFLVEFGVPANISEMVHRFDNMSVLATAYLIPWQTHQIGDIVSMEISLSMEHRCLHYRHLVIGGAALVVAYIKDYFKPFDLSEYLSSHGNSSVIRFSSSSVTLPVGVKFKVS
jgi:hypothetical protein